MYSWIAIVSFLYHGRNKKNPFEVENPTALNENRTHNTKSPFSRTSTLSIRGRHSFFLKDRATHENVPGEDEGLLGGSERADTGSDVTSRNTPNYESESPILENSSSGLQYPANPPKPRHKRIKGFMPEVLQSPDSSSSLQSTEQRKRVTNRSLETVSFKHFSI